MKESTVVVVCNLYILIFHFFYLSSLCKPVLHGLPAIWTIFLRSVHRATKDMCVFVGLIRRNWLVYKVHIWFIQSLDEKFLRGVIACLIRYTARDFKDLRNVLHNVSKRVTEHGHTYTSSENHYHNTRIANYFNDKKKLWGFVRDTIWLATLGIHWREIKREEENWRKQYTWALEETSLLMFPTSLRILQRERGMARSVLLKEEKSKSYKKIALTLKIYSPEWKEASLTFLRDYTQKITSAEIRVMSLIGRYWRTNKPNR